MKKKNRKTRLIEFRQAYYAELNKQGVMDSEPKAPTYTRNDLMKIAKERGLEVNSKMTKADLEKLITEDMEA